MSDRSPLWPARLHHFRMDSADPAALAAFYEAGLGMASRRIGDRLWHLVGPERRILIGAGEPERVGYVAFALDGPERVEALQRRVRAAGVPVEPCPSPLFGNAAFAVRDPDGRLVAFGVPGADGPGEGPSDAPASPGHGPAALPGRTQHIVFATRALAAQVRFHRDVLGFLVSDEVVDGGDVSACFLRSDEEHHSYAVFRADAPRYDHHALEVTCWNDIRDWADHFAELRVPIWWGPGRHGPGNNLFFMVRDPDGNRIEISAELEHMPPGMPPRVWPHDERTLNLWGNAWMRS